MMDIKKIRNDFPILNKKILNEKNLVYLDTAASAQKPQVVTDEINSFYFVFSYIGYCVFVVINEFLIIFMSQLYVVMNRYTFNNIPF